MAAAAGAVDTSRWVCIYPSYLDAGKTVQQGRRVVKEKAIKQPGALEVFETVKLMGLRCALENKSYSRDFHSRGRIRVQLFDEDHKPVRETVTTRRELLAQIGTNVPKYREKYGKRPEAAGKKADAAGKPEAAKAAGASASSSKKGGKKGKKKK